MWKVRPLLACRCSALLAVAVMGGSLPAQTPSFEGKLVRSIRFDPAEQPLEATELHDILPLQMNQPLRMETVRAAIERLFATGRYSDIQVDAAPYQDGVVVTFLTKNGWFIGEVHVDGGVKDPPNRSQLENATRLDLGQPFNEARLQEGIANQRRLMENNGLYHSIIRPAVLNDEEYQQVHIRFDIDSGPRAHFGTPVLLGDIKMDPKRILTATKFRRWLIGTWKPVTATRMRQGLDGVRNLYQKDNRLEAKVALDSVRFDSTLNAVIPTLRIEAGPRISINTVGAKISQKRLKRYVPVFEEHAVDHDLLIEGGRNLQDYLQSQGYFEAEVVPKEQRVINDRASIDYLINTGERHKLVHIEVGGNKYFKTNEIRERMFLQTASLLQFPHGRFSENLLRRDKESITSLYQSNGFRDVEVTHRTEDDYLGKPGNLAVFLTITEGPQYFVRRLEVTGIATLDEKALREKLSSIDDQPYSEFNVAVDRDTILARYYEAGFPNATFEWSQKPGGANLVDLSYVIHEGRQQFVRQVLINQDSLKTTKPGMVFRALRLNPGDPLSPTAMTETQRKLYDLGVFARVDMAIQDPTGETDRKYVVYQLDEARRHSVAVGFGAELARIGGGCTQCLDSPGGATGFSPRVLFDVTRNNLWGLAHSVSLRTRISTLDRRGLLTYAWPRFTDNEALSLSFTALYQDARDVRTFSSKRQEISAQLSQRTSKAVTLLFRYAYRRVSASDLKITPFLIPLVAQPVRVGLVSINLIQDRRDDPVDPHKGIYNTIDLGLAQHLFGSQRNFLRFLGRNATYHPINKRVVFARSTEVGNIYAFRFSGDPLLAIPLPERFFGGGGTSHRGFAENQAGPRDLVTGFPLGGTTLFFNQTELRFPLIGENIGGVLFHDMGNIYSRLSNFSLRVSQRDLQDFDYSVHAVGVGLRYRLPIGPVRLDLAYALNPPRYFGFKGSLNELIDAGVNPCATVPGVPSRCQEQRLSRFQFSFSIGQTF